MLSISHRQTVIPTVTDTQQAMRFAVNPIQYLDEKTAQHGEFFYTKLGVREVCVISNNEAIENILLNKEGNFIQSSATHLLDYFLGKGILTLEGEQWKAQRKRLLPYFSVRSVSANIERYGKIAASLIEDWETEEDINLLKAIKQISICVILSLITDKRPGSEIVEAFQMVTDAVMEFINMTRNPFNMRKYAGDIHQEMASRVDVVDENIYKFLETAQSDLLDKIRAAHIEDKAIRDEIVTLIAAGYESTAHAITSSIYFIEKHPEVKQQVIAEIKESFQDHQDIFKLSYLLKVVKETMRLHPPGWMFFRKAANDVVLAGRKVPANTDIMINIYNLHRNASLWEHATSFIPERFDHEKSFPESAYIPFGTGVRFCIGRNLALQEIIFILAFLYKNYELTVGNIEQYALKPDITLGVGGPFLAQLKRKDL